MKTRLDVRRFRFGLLLAALLLLHAWPAKADCPDNTFTCALGDTFDLGSSWDWGDMQCETNGSVLGEAMRECRNPGCQDVDERADGCSIPVSGLKQMWNGIFHAACDLHDICYATIGTTQAQCDRQFLSNMKSICGMPGVGSVAYQECLGSASIMYDGVVVGGGSSFTRGQKWALENCKTENSPTLPPPPIGTRLKIRSKLGVGKVVGIAGAGMDDGTPTQLQDFAFRPEQEWVIEHSVKDYYTLKAVHSGKCLDLSWGNRDDGGKVQQWGCVVNDNQRWAVKKQDDGDGWEIRSKVSDKCLEVAGANTASGTAVDQTTCNSASDGQRWYLLELTAPPLGKDVRISGEYSWPIGIEGAGTENGTKTVLTDWTNGPYQKWQIEYVGDDSYRLIVQHTKKCLDLSNGSTDDGAQVQQWTCDPGTDNQKWRIEPIGGGLWRIRPKASAKCLDAKGLSNQIGTQVYSWSCTGAINQSWKIEVL